MLNVWYQIVYYFLFTSVRYYPILFKLSGKIVLLSLFSSQACGTHFLFTSYSSVCYDTMMLILLYSIGTQYLLRGITNLFPIKS